MTIRGALGSCFPERLTECPAAALADGAAAIAAGKSPPFAAVTRLPVRPKRSLEHPAAAPAIDATAAEFPDQMIVLRIYRSAADIAYGNWWNVPAHPLPPRCPATAGRSLARVGHVVTALAILTTRTVRLVRVVAMHFYGDGPACSEIPAADRC